MIILGIFKRVFTIILKITMSIKYIRLPIYSIAVFGQYLYFAGGGGGSTGIPNQIKIFHKAISQQAANSVNTGNYIIQNLVVDQQRKMLVCNANQFVVVYDIEQNGKNLVERYRFQSDLSQRHGNVNALCLSSDGSTVMTGCQDQSVRFHKLHSQQAQLLHQYGQHSHQIKSVDHNHKELYLSTDNYLIVVCNLQKKQIVRQVYQDMFMPQKTLFRAGYFVEIGGDKIIVAHYIPREKTFVTKEVKDKLHTVEVAKDQVSMTYYHPRHKLLGIACANGQTMLLSSQNLSLKGSQNNLKSGVNACFISKKKFMISGTSNCSYHVQGPQSSLSLPWSYILTIGLTLMFMYLVVNPQNFEL